MKKGYVNGSDMLLYVNGKAVGHCSTHSVNVAAETKEHAVKPVASEPMANSLYKGKSVSSLSISVSAEGINNYDETEGGYAYMLGLMTTGQPVTLRCMERDTSATPYLEGKFVITALDRTDPAQDDSTYSASFENDGAPSVFDSSVLTVGAAE